MGEYADDAVDREFAGEYWDNLDEESESDPEFAGYFHRAPTAKTCRMCHETGLHWKQVGGKWRLFNGSKLHHCSVKPLPTNTP